MAADASSPNSAQQKMSSGTPRFASSLDLGPPSAASSARGDVYDAGQHHHHHPQHQQHQPINPMYAPRSYAATPNQPPQPPGTGPPPAAGPSADPPWFGNLASSSSLPDGEQFVHLPTPFMPPGGSSSQDPLAVGPTHTLPSPQLQPKIGPTRNARGKKDKLRDDPQTLEELRDPIPGSKPDYPYPVLIRCAILSHSKRSPTLAEIYEMIHHRFPFFKTDDASWKNSVRHYLSISPSFEKLPRPITEPGKGNYWTYNANPTEKTRRKPNRNKSLKNRPDDDLDNDPSALATGKLPPPPLLHTPSSSDSLSRDRGIASRQNSPAHVWLEARDTFGPGPPRTLQRESLPSADSLLKDHGPYPRVGGAAGPQSAPYSAAEDAYHHGVPQSPYGQGSAGIRAGGPPLPPHGTGENPGYMYPREQQPYSRPGSTYSSQSSLPPLSESFYRSSADAGRAPPPRHGDERSLPSVSTNGNYGGPSSSYSHPSRGPPYPDKARDDNAPQGSYRYDPLPPPHHPPNGQW